MSMAAIGIVSTVVSAATAGLNAYVSSKNAAKQAATAGLSTTGDTFKKQDNAPSAAGNLLGTPDPNPISTPVPPTDKTKPDSFEGWLAKQTPPSVPITQTLRQPPSTNDYSSTMVPDRLNLEDKASAGSVTRLPDLLTTPTSTPGAQSVTPDVSSTTTAAKGWGMGDYTDAITAASASMNAIGQLMKKDPPPPPAPNSYSSRGEGPNLMDRLIEMGGK